MMFTPLSMPNEKLVIVARAAAIAESVSKAPSNLVVLVAMRARDGLCYLAFFGVRRSRLPETGGS
jgi:hypothetical protein